MQTTPSTTEQSTQTTRLVVNGLETEAAVDLHLLDDVLIPALRGVMEQADPQVRTFVFLVGPPGVGKSTLAALIAQRASEQDKPLQIDAIGIDGFHQPHAELERQGLVGVKGAPQTFDPKALAELLAQSRDHETLWPVYDRTLHDVRPDVQPVRAPLVLLEGNWLLLDEPEWASLSEFSAFNIFIDAAVDSLRERLVGRKVQGGLTPEAAADFYERSDRRNVERVLRDSDRSKVDLMLHFNPDGTMSEGVAT